MIEHELKITGNPQELQSIVKTFMSHTKSHRDRHYSFNTYYLDTPDFKLYRSGWSLRHRTGAMEIGKTSGTELKAVEGCIGNITARLEIGCRGDDPKENLKTILRHTNCPDLPCLKNDGLSVVFATAVRRLERQVMFTEDVMIESALDDMQVLRAVETTGSGLFDVVLWNVGDIQHELEFEIKPVGRKDIDSHIMNKCEDFLMNTCVNGYKNVSISKVSKAKRAMQLFLK